MTDPVTNLPEWHTFRSQLRSQLLGLVDVALPAGLRPDAWSPRQVLHHVLLVDESTASLLERLAAKAQPLTPRAADPWPVRPELMDFPLDTAFSVPAFRGTEPKAEVSDKTLRSLGDSTWKRHQALAEMADQLRLDEVVFPHPLAGRLTFHEWLVFGGVHEKLHLTQLQRDLT